MATVRFPEIICPRCGTALNAATDMIGEASPKHGDYSICIKCGHVTVFELADGRFTLREPTEQEAIEIRADPTIAAQQQAVWLLNDRRRQKGKT